MPLRRSFAERLAQNTPGPITYATGSLKNYTKPQTVGETIKAIELMTIGEEFPKPKRARSASLVRHVLKSDYHPFVGRIYDLSVISMKFDNWDEVNKYPDCKYSLETNEYLHALTARVESLNLVGDLLWPKPLPTNFREFPVSRYEWLTVALDVFLVRYVSVVDCALLLTNQIFQCNVKARNCTSEALSKKGVASEVIAILDGMLVDQGRLRTERNFRVHQGVERGFTQDDATFRMAALFEHRYGGIRGEDQFGRRINVMRFFKEALVELQRDFNIATRRLVHLLDSLYDRLGEEFEERFGPLIRASTHGFNAGAKQKHEATAIKPPLKPKRGRCERELRDMGGTPYPSHQHLSIPLAISKFPS